MRSIAFYIIICKRSSSFTIQALHF